MNKTSIGGKLELHSHMPEFEGGEEKSMSSQSDENISTLETIAFKGRF